MNIVRGTNVVVSVKPTGSQQRELMGKDVVKMNFVLNSFIQLAIGDKITVYGNDYYLNQYPVITKVSSFQFNYECEFEAEGYGLNKVMFLNYDNSNELTVSEFPLTLDASGFLDLIVANMNRAGSGWTKGNVDETDVATISFSGDNCRAALSKVAEQFGTEFWFEGKQINFTKKGTLTTHSFEYGKGKGLYEVKRSMSDDKNVFSRLYAYGGTRNIPASYGDRLRLPGSYIQKTEQFENYGLIEVSKTWEDIYPHRTGTVSATTGPLNFSDSGMDFDVNDQLIEGVTAKVVFKTGDLAGYEFVVSKYDNASKTFTILKNKNEKAFEIPSADLKPAVGDKYTIVDIEMPQTYIDAAEAELQTAAEDYYDTNSNGRELYSVDCDPIYFRSQNIDALKVGDFVTIVDSQMGINRQIRIIGIERDLVEQFKYTLTLADTATIATIVREYFEDQRTQIIIRRNNLDNVNKARRNWRNTADLEDLVFDPEGHYYTEKIKPKSIETLYLAAGAKAQNYSLNGVIIKPNYQADENELQITAGRLVHYTLEIEGVGSVWEMEEKTFSGLVATQSYYLFAKINTSALTGTWELLTEPVEIDNETGYWTIGVGVLFAVEDGYRNFEFNKGMTYIVGDTIKTGKIQSMDAQNYFNLTSGKFNLGNSTSGLDWDVTRADTLTIRGGLVQNRGGQTDTLGVFRGDWQAGATYYKGDTTYYDGSTWKWISDQDGNVEPGSDDAKWKKIASRGKNAPRIIYETNTDLYDAPPIDRTNPDTQGWTLFLPGSDWAKILAGSDGKVIVTDEGIEIVTGEALEYVWACTEVLDENGKFVEWKIPTRITGRPGEKGDYVEFRYKKNGSTTVPPPLSDADKTNPEPDGWTIEKPAISAAEYIWYISCTKEGNGTMITPWSDPEPTRGVPGDPGPWMNYRGLYDPDKKYHGGSDYINAVYYNGYYYIARSDAGNFKGVLPTDKSKWNPFGAQFESIATGLLLARTAYIDKLIVDTLSTSADNSKPRVTAKDAEIDVFDANETLHPMIRMGKGAGIMSSAPDDKPGIALRDTAGDASYTENSSEGIFSNGSGVGFLPGATGLKSNSSIVALLQKRNDDPRGISAAVVGIDQTDNGSSESWGGYFSSLKVTGETEFDKGVTISGFRIKAKRISTNYIVQDEDVSLYCYNSNVIHVTLPNDPETGRTLIIRRVNNSGVSVDGDSDHEILSAGSASTNFGIPDPRDTVLLQWDGQYWQALKITA